MGLAQGQQSHDTALHYVENRNMDACAVGTAVFSRIPVVQSLIHRSGVVRPAGGVASFGRDGELHSPNPLRTRRKGAPFPLIRRDCRSGLDAK